MSKHRWEILSDLIIKHNCKIIAEIGVSRGLNALGVLIKCSSIIEKYYLIDPDLGEVFDYKSFESYQDKISFWKMTSQDSSLLIGENNFDLIFIDANHEYESVKKDIFYWKTKIRQGGILCGHDYLISDNDPSNGVAKAVKEKFEEVNLEQDVIDPNVKLWWTYVNL